MRLINNKILENLDSLININLEVQSGYRSAAEIINNKNLKEIFVIYIQKIAEDINELKKLEKDLAGDNKNINHQLKNFPFQVLNVDEISVLRKCEMLEEKSIKEYEIVLNEEFPLNIKEIFLKQYNRLQETRLHMRSLEDQY
ncbi:MAG: hypothetical protein P8Z35_08100 [Ignavibacteriaceae bacterium]|jgi:uncharacterized protein (TIGR02284 family)